jgi:hypothetical protein
VARLTGRRGALALLAFALPPAAGAQAPAAPPIQDNSFLIEEAYNQERGVVQHISTFQRTGGAWAYSFTEEWPVRGIRHQLSYTIPVSHQSGLGTGLGDVALNYRLQLAGSGRAALALAPRLSLLLPTGSAPSGRGSGAVGVQVFLPASVVLAPSLVSHLNAGFTVTPEAHGPADARATATGLAAGASVIWLATRWMNLMLEGVWSRSQVVTSAGQLESAGNWTLSPGIRWAIDVPGGLQVVPGVAWPIAVGGGGSDYLFLYLSFEHPFRH